MDFPTVNDKLAFFDFDRTLVSHTYSAEYNKSRQGSYFKECLHVLTRLEDEHANDKPLPCMQWYVNKLFEDGYGIYVMTHEIFNLRDEMKKNLLKSFYPDVLTTYLTVDIPEHKIDMIRAVAAVEGCPLSDVIFVDDRMDTVNLALAAGIDAKHLSDIVVLYETSRAFRQQNSELMKDGALDTSINNLTGQISGNEEQIVQESLQDVYLECKRLAEMNGHDDNPTHKIRF